MARIEEAGLNASAPPQQRLLDGWLVRFSPGKAKRARCVNALSVGRLPLDRKLAECREIYDAAELPMIFRMTPFSEPPALDAALHAAGYQRYEETLVLVLEHLPNQAEHAVSGSAVMATEGTAFAHAVGALCVFQRSWTPVSV